MSRIHQHVVAISLATLVALVTGIGHAQTAVVPPERASTAGTPVATNRAGQGVEGWAVVRYSVLADGSTANIRVVATAPPAVDSAPAIAEVGRWRFSPATADGSAVDWHNNESTVMFAAANADSAAAAAFVEAYESIRALNEAEDFDAARTASDRLLNELALRRQDVGIALAQAAIIEIGAGDFQAAHELVRLATLPEPRALAGADLFVALQLRFQVEVQLGRTADALATHGRIAAGYGPDDTDPFASVVEDLEYARENEQFIAASGMVRERSWELATSRRYFYVDNIEGSIATLTAECDRQRLELPFQPDADYRLPERLGACTIVINGEPGTSFSLVEVLVEDQ